MSRGRGGGRSASGGRRTGRSGIANYGTVWYDESAVANRTYNMQWHTCVHVRYMEDLFFRSDKKIMLEHLFQVAEGVGWDELHLNARITIQRYLRDQEESSLTIRREQIKALLERGLHKEGTPLGLRNFEY